MRFVCLVVLAMLVFASPVRADEFERPRGSVFAAFNLGVGWAKATVGDEAGTVAESDAQAGPTWGFRLGTAVSEILTLGIDYVGYASATDQPADFDRIESEFWVIGPSLSWYPFSRGVFLKGLIGWGGVEFTVDVDADTRLRASEDSLGLLGSIGYEIPVTTLLSVGAEVDYVWMNVAEVDVADGVGGTGAADFNFSTIALNAFVIINY